MTTLRVAIIDDHAMFRRGVRAEIDGPVEIVAEAEDVESAVMILVETKPDVVLLDVHMPGGGGLEVIRRLHIRHPDMKFLALSVSDAAEDVIGIIRAGARGYVTKNISGPELLDAIDRVAAGDAVFSPGSLGSSLMPSPEPSRSRRSTRRSIGSPSVSARSCGSLRAATRTRRSPRSSSSRSRRLRPTCRACCASSSSPVGTSSPAGPTTAA